MHQLFAFFCSKYFAVSIFRVLPIFLYITVYELGLYYVRGINFSRFLKNFWNPRKIDAREDLLFYYLPLLARPKKAFTTQKSDTRSAQGLRSYHDSKTQPNTAKTKKKTYFSCFSQSYFGQCFFFSRKWIFAEVNYRCWMFSRFSTKKKKSRNLRKIPAPKKRSVQY